jgi:hypothetical protein
MQAAAAFENSWPDEVCACGRCGAGADGDQHKRSAAPRHGVHCGRALPQGVLPAPGLRPGRRRGRAQGGRLCLRSGHGGALRHGRAAVSALPHSRRYPRGRPPSPGSHCPAPPTLFPVCLCVRISNVHGLRTAQGIECCAFLLLKELSVSIVDCQLLWMYRSLLLREACAACMCAGRVGEGMCGTPQGSVPFWPSVLSQLTGYTEASSPPFASAIAHAGRLCSKLYTSADSAAVTAAAPPPPSLM